jgi:hypothetical protein
MDEELEGILVDNTRISEIVLVIIIFSFLPLMGILLASIGKDIILFYIPLFIYLLVIIAVLLGGVLIRKRIEIKNNSLYIYNFFGKLTKEIDLKDTDTSGLAFIFDGWYWKGAINAANKLQVVKKGEMVFEYNTDSFKHEKINNLKNETFGDFGRILILMEFGETTDLICEDRYGKTIFCEFKNNNE